MCDSRQHGDVNMVPLDVQHRILSDNERMAAHNRHHFLERTLLAINVMGSPGAGKTAILEATARALNGRRLLGALAGDLATDHDARRLAAAGIRAESITTGSACHLDAAMVHHALHHLPWGDLDYLFIENVGNLVCPAVYDLGQTANVVVLAVTEGGQAAEMPGHVPQGRPGADFEDRSCRTSRTSASIGSSTLRRVMSQPRYLAVSARTGKASTRGSTGCSSRSASSPRAARGARDHTHV